MGLGTPHGPCLSGHQLQMICLLPTYLLTFLLSLDQDHKRPHTKNITVFGVVPEVR